MKNIFKSFVRDWSEVWYIWHKFSIVYFDFHCFIEANAHASINRSRTHANGFFYMQPRNELKFDGKLIAQTVPWILDAWAVKCRVFYTIPTWKLAIYGGTVSNAFDAGKYITRASGRGLGPGNRDFLAPNGTVTYIKVPRTLRCIKIHIFSCYFPWPWKSRLFWDLYSTVTYIKERSGA